MSGSQEGWGPVTAQRCLTCSGKGWGCCSPVLQLGKLRHVRAGHSRGAEPEARDGAGPGPYLPLPGVLAERQKIRGTAASCGEKSPSASARPPGEGTRELCQPKALGFQEWRQLQARLDPGA
jgi:hypothetical protein